MESCRQFFIDAKQLWEFFFRGQKQNNQINKKKRFPMTTYPIPPHEYKLWLSNLNVWLSTQDPQANWATVVYLELPKQMQRMVAQIPGSRIIFPKLSLSAERLKGMVVDDSTAF